MDRTILHCDCNSYFASVESIDRPELREVPMAVCGDPQQRHGIILAQNTLAKSFGVRTPEPIWQALRKCPGLVLIEPHFEKYKKYSELINSIYLEYTDQVEPFSIDESWLDVTGSLHLFGDGKTIADTLRKRVWNELHLTISVGVSFNKTFAKIGSDYKKPDATTVISRDNYKEIVWALPAGDMLFIGKKAAALLGRYGIRTIGDVARCEREQLADILGKSGESVWRFANGQDDSPVKRFGEHEPVKSVSNNITFPRDLKGENDIRQGLLLISDQVGTRLRRQGFYGSVVHVMIKDPDLKVISRQKKLVSPTNITREIFRTAESIVSSCWNYESPIRMLSVGVSDLSMNGGFQLDFFTDKDVERREQKLDQALDGIRERFGKNSVTYGSVLKSDLRRR